MSRSGLAILAGITKQSLSTLIGGLNPSDKTPSESLKPWVGIDLDLSVSTTKRGGQVQILKSEFCSAVIQHYAFAGNKVAQISLTRFAGMGIDKWIQQQTGWDSTLTDLQGILILAQNALAQHEELAARTDSLEELVHQHDGEVDRIFHPDGKYFSIRGYSKKLKQQVTKQEASEKGRAAAKISRQLGIAIDKLEDPRYGEVNIYHESILEQVF